MVRGWTEVEGGEKTTLIVILGRLVEGVRGSSEILSYLLTLWLVSIIRTEDLGLHCSNFFIASNAFL